MQFVQRYRIPKTVGDALIHRKKEVVVIISPYCPPEPSGLNYDQYCNLMTNWQFRQLGDLLGSCESHVEAYAHFLQSNTSLPSLADDIHRLEAMDRDVNAEDVSSQ